MTMAPSLTHVCANCGRPVAAEELHPTADVTSNAEVLCPTCWFDAEKE